MNHLHWNMARDTRFTAYLDLVWQHRRCFLVPLFLLPAIATIHIYLVPREYRTHSTVTIDPTFFAHRLLEDYRSTLDLERRFPTIKRQVTGNKSVYGILGIEAAGNHLPENPDILEEARERIKVELTRSGIVSISYSGSDPHKVKKVVDNAVEAFLAVTFEPLRGIGQNLRRSLENRDRILSSIILPNFHQAEVNYEDARRNFTEQAFEYVSAKYEYETWLERRRNREKAIEAQLRELIPLKRGNLDTSRIVRIVVPAEIPQNPFRPRQGRILLFSLIVGVVLGVLLVCFRRFLDDSIRRPSEIEEILGVPVIGRVPRLWEAEIEEAKKQTLPDFGTVAVQTQEARNLILDDSAYLPCFHETAKMLLPSHVSRIVELKVIGGNSAEKRAGPSTFEHHVSQPIESSRAPPIQDVAA